jgi:UDP-2-acetamido-3-amino-2,3-dideoxy-glucuronate N-acetyltransferase
MSRIEMPSFIDLQSISTELEGSLGVVECEKLLPFQVKRTFFAYDMPEATIRGRHANRTLQEFFICLSGTATVETTSPAGSASFILADRSKGLLIPPLNWITLTAESSNTIWLVLASAPYNADDQLRDFDQFQVLASG